jgi:hypothetical protein
LRVVDGFRARGIEKEENVKERKLFHRNIGFKLRLIGKALVGNQSKLVLEDKLLSSHFNKIKSKQD